MANLEQNSVRWNRFQRSRRPLSTRGLDIQGCAHLVGKVLAVIGLSDKGDIQSHDLVRIAQDTPMYRET